MRQRAALLFLAAVLVLLAGCGGDLDPSPAATSPPSEPTPTTPDLTASRAGMSSTRAQPAASPVPARKRGEIVSRAQDTAAAIARWDEQLAACIGPEGHADDSGATCTHAAWGRLVFQVDVAVWYLLGDLRDMPPDACHEALGAQLDALRGFWQGAAPLDLEWLDPQQRPPVLYDLDSAVALIRPVPSRIRDAVTTACSG
jgi:hypothetical protein